MKRLFYYIALGITVLVLGSCGKKDNFDPPAETLKGDIIDAGTGERLQGEVSGESGNTATGTRIKLLEISWSDNPTPFYIGTKQDGTYTNTKVFAGRYKISAEGPFVSLVQSGATPVDNSQTVDVKGITTVNFEVEPLLRIEWVGEPVLNSNGSVTVQVRVTRGTTNPGFQGNVTDIDLFTSNTNYVGSNNFDSRYSTRTAYSGTNGNARLGETISITSTGVLPTSRNHYLRVGARTAQTVDGQRLYNYNEPKMITIP